MKKRVIIVHGWGGSPDTDFLPWAKEELKKKGYKVITPAMPDPDNPRIETWVPYLAEVIGNPQETDILAGHSIGCSTILRYLETLSDSKKMDKVILVAPWAVALSDLGDDEDEAIAKPWLQTPLDFDKVKTKAKSFIAIFSNSDPFVPLEGNKKALEEQLESQIIVEHNKGHFNEMPQERPDSLLDLFKG